MVDGKRLVEYINTKHTQEFKHCLNPSVNLIDEFNINYDLIMKYVNSFGMKYHRSDLSYNTYEDYLKDARYPISKRDFETLEKI